jgi:hypothetical protein
MGERERLKREFTRLRRRVRIGARILLLGLGVEIVVLLIFAHGKSWCETASFILSVIVVIIGVWIEESAGNQAEDVAEELQHIADSDVANAGARAADANRRAQEAEARAAEANQKAEEAHLEAERVRLEFAKYREDRKLDAEQIERIAAKLRQFPRTGYVGGVAFEAPEIMHLMEGIEHALWRAEWNQIDCPDGQRLFRPATTRRFICKGVDAENVRILLLAGSQSLPDSAAAIRRTGEWAALESAGSALAAALMAEDIEATFDATRVALVGAPPRTTLNVMIGPKR